MIALMTCSGAYAQKKKETVNDSNTPLHLLQPDYNVPYGTLTVDEVKADMDRILHYLENTTPTRVVNKNNGRQVTDYTKIDSDSQLERGTFRLASYEWGVTYSAMLAAAEATGDKAYYNYVADRFKFLAEVAPYFRALLNDGKEIDPQMKQILAPHALDDAGAVCAAMIKFSVDDKSVDLAPLIDNYMDFILNKEYRLADGTFARTRPQHNTVWLDDMFMGIPPVAYYSLLGDDAQQKSRQGEAVRQVLQFADRMWVPEKKLFRHGWVEGMTDHPAFHWGRANGWALLTMCEVLDVLPENYPQRDKILNLFREHVRGLAALQSGEGFWHQLLDRNDSYLESSATAIYTYCMAHAINKGWIDAMAYGPVVTLAWHALTTIINDKGQVDKTCVGTGMAFDPAFYYYRPVNVYAAHGYGPVIWAGAEMVNLLNKQHPKMNDSAVQFYRTEQKTTEPIFHVTDGE
jgi:rhamnogalacturonyl hydrolase YesR